MRGAVLVSVAITFLALGWVIQARPHQNHKLAKREATDLLNAVRDELVHAKRHRRGLVEPPLSRAKRQEVGEEGEEASLSRVKRNRREADEIALKRSKRHKRNAAENELSRQKSINEENSLDLGTEPNTKGEIQTEGQSTDTHKPIKDETGSHVGTAKESEVNRGRKHDRECKGAHKEFKHIVKKAMKRAKKSMSKHGHKKKDGKHATHRKQNKSKAKPKKKFAKELSKFKRLGKELAHGVSKQMKHLYKLKTEKSKHFKRAKRSKHAKHHK